jgi:hypothetical protein
LFGSKERKGRGGILMRVREGEGRRGKIINYLPVWFKREIIN